MLNKDNYKIKYFICLCLILSPVFSYDQFDIQVCKAIPNELERDKCLRDLKGDFSEFNIPEVKKTTPDLKPKTVKKYNKTSKVDKNSFRRVGYFKDKARNRIFTIEMKDDFNASQANAFAKNQPNTLGQVTAVYFYPSGSVIPADGVTRARNMFKANDVLYETKGLSKWRYAYMKRFNSSETFVDCLKNKTELCRD